MDGYKINRKKTLSLVQGFFIHRVAAATPPGVPDRVAFIANCCILHFGGKKQKTSLQQCPAFRLKYNDSQRRKAEQLFGK